MPILLSEDVGLMVWSSLAGGFLSGKFDREGKTAEGRRVAFDFPPIDRERAYGAIDVMRAIAADKGCTVPQVTIGWLRHQKVVTSVILGAKRVDQLVDTIGATEVSLSDEDLAALDKVTADQRQPPWPVATTTLAGGAARKTGMPVWRAVPPA